MAPSTERRFTRDLMLEAVPNSSANIFATREIWSLGGMINDIMLVPLLRKEKKRGCEQLPAKATSVFIPYSMHAVVSPPSLPRMLHFTVIGAIPLLLDNNGREKKTKQALQRI